jgi:hypothetical protein
MAKSATIIGRKGISEPAIVILLKYNIQDYLSNIANQTSGISYFLHHFYPWTSL